jgi:hypothetical protein
VDDQNAERAEVPAVNAEEDSDEQGSWPVLSDHDLSVCIRDSPDARSSPFRGRSE